MHTHIHSQTHTQPHATFTRTCSESRMDTLGCYVYLGIQHSVKMKQKIHKIAQNTPRGGIESIVVRKQTCRIQNSTSKQIINCRRKQFAYQEKIT